MGATAMAAIRSRLSRPRLFGCSVDIEDHVQGDDGGAQGKPLQRVSIVAVDARVGASPLAQQPGAQIIPLLDDDRLQVQGESCPRTFHPYVLPQPASPPTTTQR